jgi:ADP-heptose:LPS heptosyltransferase
MMPVEFLPLQRDVPIDARVPCLRFPSLPVLAGGVAATRLFVATDAGPMHLAGCTPVPTVGLFRATDPALYRPLKPRDLAICVTRLTPQEVANRVYNHWRTLR